MLVVSKGDSVEDAVSFLAFLAIYISRVRSNAESRAKVIKCSLDRVHVTDLLQEEFPHGMGDVAFKNIGTHIPQQKTLSRGEKARKRMEIKTT